MHTSPLCKLAIDKQGVSICHRSIGSIFTIVNLFQSISGGIWTFKTQLMFLVQSLQAGHIMCSIVYMNLGKFVQSEC